MLDCYTQHRGNVGWEAWIPVGILATTGNCWESNPRLCNQQWLREYYRYTTVLDHSITVPVWRLVCVLSPHSYSFHLKRVLPLYCSTTPLQYFTAVSQYLFDIWYVSCLLELLVHLLHVDLAVEEMVLAPQVLVPVCQIVDFDENLPAKKVDDITIL